MTRKILTMTSDQRAMFEWSTTNQRGIISAGMGTGKTHVAALILRGAGGAGAGVGLYLCPLGTMENVARELTEVEDADFPELSQARVLLYRGPAASRHARLSHFLDESADEKSADEKSAGRPVIITTYETVVAEYQTGLGIWGMHREITTIIIDEAHILRNPRTLRFTLCKILTDAAGAGVYCMTGTPIVNGRGDLLALESLAGSKEMITVLGPGPEMWGQGNETRTIDVKFGREQFRIYDALRTGGRQVLERYLENRTRENLGFLLALVTRLRQAAFSPDAIPDYDRSIVRMVEKSRHGLRPGLEQEQEPEPEKIREIRKILEASREASREASGAGAGAGGEEKVVIFSWSVRTLRLIQRSIGGILYTGEMTAGERLGAIAEWSQDGAAGGGGGGGAAAGPLLVSLLAGGTGLNLQRGNWAVIVDPWWNRAVEDQAIGRICRMGQTRLTHVIRLVTKGSIESWILESLRGRKELEIAAADGGGAGAGGAAASGGRDFPGLEWHLSQKIPEESIRTSEKK